MGIDSRDVAALFAFLELVLPLETYNIRQNRASAPPLVSSVGVEIRIDTTGLHLTSQDKKNSSASPRSDDIDAENRAAIDRATLLIEKNFEESNMPPTSIDTTGGAFDMAQSQDMGRDNEVISRFKYKSFPLPERARTSRLNAQRTPLGFYRRLNRRACRASG